MSLSKRDSSNGALLEKVITSNDLGGLTSFEKVEHIKNVCVSLGLNPLTKPIQLLKFQGKEIAYFTKDATEQLRKINNVSITKIENKILDGIYIVTVYAQLPDGRQDSSTGAITISSLKGDALCNAILKAETKAKRRVTLSICGLGYIDESEADSIPNATKMDIEKIEEKVIKDETLRLDALQLIQTAQTLDELKLSYQEGKEWLSNDEEGIKILNKETNRLKEKLENKNESF